MESTRAKSQYNDETSILALDRVFQSTQRKPVPGRRQAWLVRHRSTARLIFTCPKDCLPRQITVVGVGQVVRLHMSLYVRNAIVYIREIPCEAQYLGDDPKKSEAEIRE